MRINGFLRKRRKTPATSNTKLNPKYSRFSGLVEEPISAEDALLNERIKTINELMGKLKKEKGLLKKEDIENLSNILSFPGGKEVDELLKLVRKYPDKEISFNILYNAVNNHPKSGVFLEFWFRRLLRTIVNITPEHFSNLDKNKKPDGPIFSKSIDFNEGYVVVSGNENCVEQLSTKIEKIENWRKQFL